MIIVVRKQLYHVPARPIVIVANRGYADSDDDDENGDENMDGAVPLF